MILESLQKAAMLNKLHNSYIINSDDTDKAINITEKFIAKHIFKIDNAKNYCDYMLVEKADASTRNIPVDQIRKMQDFLYKTSVVSGKKVAIIKNAELMNLNAANCCLKLLEDTPPNTHIFLITSKINIILPTILSRCAKITENFNLSNNDIIINEEYIMPCLASTNIEEKLKFFSKFSNKDRDLWSDFTYAIELCLSNLVKYYSNIKVNLSQTEEKLIEQLGLKPLHKIQEKYQDITQIINNTNQYDLDIKTSTILITNRLCNKN